ncbi:MAG: VWA domain-containing protein [bacterium]|nr:VWA domain-containing protein [bacterium]
MTGLSITFSRPWYLLLLVAIAALVLIPHFLLSKKYRRTRNRIIPIVCHLIIAVFAVSLLAGITFTYYVPNFENEIIIAVDMSLTTDKSRNKRDELVNSIIEQAEGDNYKIGIVTFGFDCSLAVPLTYDTDKVFEEYKNASQPKDITATDIASAVNFSAALFEHPKSAKIIVVTDGKETDNDLYAAARLVTSKGILLDSVYFDEESTVADVQISGISLPERYFREKEKVSVTVTLNSTNKDTVLLSLKDNDKDIEGVQDVRLELSDGEQRFDFSYTFETRGIHKLSATITSENVVKVNDTYNTYVNIENYNKILIIETFDDDSDYLVPLLEGKNADGKFDYLLGESTENFEVTRKKITDADVPKTVTEFLMYDEIIINNVSVASMNEIEGFQTQLESYVKEYGGGLFTVGGNDENGVVNLYRTSDLSGSVLQRMMPVTINNYSPKIGIMYIIDVSGSMQGDSITRAKSAVKTVIDTLEPSDKVGVMTLASTYEKILPLTSASEKDKIIKAVDNLGGNGGTSYTESVATAASTLLADTSIDRRHIVIISDCQVAQSEPGAVDSMMKGYYKDSEITLSIIGIGVTEGSNEYNDFAPICKKYGGKLYPISGNYEDISNLLREDVKRDKILNSNTGLVHPKYAATANGIYVGGDLVPTGSSSSNELGFMISGFYGGELKRDEDDSNSYLAITGKYEVPIYALRDYGKGKVGSFMCDLKGNWSKGPFETDGKTEGGLYDTVYGQLFVYKMLYSLMPSKDIKNKEVSVTLSGSNYVTTLEVFTDIKEGDTLTAVITDTADENVRVSINKASSLAEDAMIYVTKGLNDKNSNASTSAEFVIKKPGVYRIEVTKKTKDGKEYSAEIYRSFSYSAEYDEFKYDTAEVKGRLTTASARTGGVMIDDEDVSKVFATFVTEESFNYDPRYLFMILSLVLFLIEVAVRKFKFKWPHEIIRKIKQDKEQQ